MKKNKKKTIKELTDQKKINKAIHGCLQIFDNMRINPLESNMITSYLDCFAFAILHDAKIFKTEKEMVAAKQEIEANASKMVNKTMRKRQEVGVDESKLGQSAPQGETELRSMYR